MNGRHASTADASLNTFKPETIRINSGFLFLIMANIVTTSKALVTRSDALVPSSLLILIIAYCHYCYCFFDLYAFNCFCVAFVVSFRVVSCTSLF